MVYCVFFAPGENSTGEESSESSLGFRSALILIFPCGSGPFRLRGWLRGEVACAIMGSHLSFICTLVWCILLTYLSHRSVWSGSTMRRYS